MKILHERNRKERKQTSNDHRFRSKHTDFPKQMLKEKKILFILLQKQLVKKKLHASKKTTKCQAYDFV